MKRFLLFLLLISCSSPSFVHFGDVKFAVELADSPEERKQGLMFRESLPEKQGMLFVFDDIAVRGFWMKNTIIPLDMIFIDQNWIVVEVKSNIQPCNEEPCPSYHSVPAKYVLEINAGLAEKYGIGVNSTVFFK